MSNDPIKGPEPDVTLRVAVLQNQVASDAIDKAAKDAYIEQLLQEREGLLGKAGEKP